jgi:hypothetical protein
VNIRLQYYDLWEPSFDVSGSRIVGGLIQLPVFRITLMSQLPYVRPLANFSSFYMILLNTMGITQNTISPRYPPQRTPSLCLQAWPP